MSALDGVLNPDHFARPDALYNVHPSIVSGAALGVSSRQLVHGADFPVAKYTPGSPLGAATLTSANMAQSIRNAWAAAAAAGGGTVRIPAGQWEIGDEQLAFTTTHARDSIVIRGAGMDTTQLIVETPYTGECIKFSGEASPGDFFYNGGVRDLTIAADAFDAGNVGCGIHIEACINMQFRNVTVRNLAGGSGFRSRKVGADGTNQYVQLFNCTCATNGINWDLEAFVNCQGYGVYAAFGQIREYLFDDVKASFYGGNFQSSAPVCVELAGGGGCRIALYDYYYEGFSPALFKLNAPGLTFNAFSVDGFIMNAGGTVTLLDADAFNVASLKDIYAATAATTVYKGRNGPSVHLINVADPITFPGKFDLDAASDAKLVCHGLGGIQYTGGRALAALGTSLPSFATGAEPGSPVNGDMVRDSSYDRPSYRSASAWNRMAFVSDDNDLTALLTPYCAEVFDPQLGRLRSVISGELDALTGMLHASALTAPTSGQRPTWHATDDQFGGRASFECALSGNHFVAGSLGQTIPIGSYPGLLVVYRATVAGTDSGRRVAAALEDSSHNTSIMCGHDDGNSAGHPYGYYKPGVAGASLINASGGLDVAGHVSLLLANSTGDFEFFGFDQNAIVHGLDYGAITGVVDRIHLGGVWNSASYDGCDVAIAYCAVLKAMPTADIMARIMRVAMSKYGLR